MHWPPDGADQLVVCRAFGDARQGVTNALRCQGSPVAMQKLLQGGGAGFVQAYMEEKRFHVPGISQSKL